MDTQKKKSLRQKKKQPKASGASEKRRADKKQAAAQQTNESSAVKIPIGLLIISLILLAVGIAVPRLFALSPSFTEKYFTQSVFPKIRSVTGYLATVADFSITELVLLIVILTFISCVIAAVIKIFAKRFRISSLLRNLCIVLFIFTVLLNIFNLTGGINYYNETLDKKLALDVKPRTENQLYGLCVYLRGEANKLRQSVAVNSDGTFSINDTDRYMQLAADAVEQIEEINPKGTEIPPAKSADYMSGTMRLLGISGIHMPFFSESTINSDQPALLLPFTAAHECAHYMGIMREDEANFTAYLACVGSDDVNMRYSGTMGALLYASNELYNVNKSLYRELLNGYSDDLIRDIKSYAEYWNQGDGIFSDISSEINDAYLKYNGSPSGEASYGKMTDLLLAYYAKQNTTIHTD